MSTLREVLKVVDANEQALAISDGAREWDAIDLIGVLQETDKGIAELDRWAQWTVNSEGEGPIEFLDDAGFRIPSGYSISKVD